LFLFTELLLFGGLFLVYSVYRYNNPADFAAAGEHLDVFVGTFNTVILITSSLTVALSITAIQKGNSRLAVSLIVITIIFALLFMLNKYFEWGHKFHEGIYPGGEAFKSLPPGQGLYYLLYYFMTGLHGLHVLVGAVFLAFIIRMIKKGKVRSDSFAIHENAGLYWHLVDLIWIFLFPLFYLIH
jgi:cytochrome c oxidase subunit 3